MGINCSVNFSILIHMRQEIKPHINLYCEYILNYYKGQKFISKEIFVQIFFKFGFLIHLRSFAWSTIFFFHELILFSHCGIKA